MLAQIPRCDILGVGISNINLYTGEQALYDAVEEPGFQGYVTVTGVHGVVESQSDADLLAIHNASYLSTPDGMPMVWLGRAQGFSTMDRVYGPELMLNVIMNTAKSGHTHYFYGGAEGVAHQLKERLISKFTGLQVVGTMCPPFRPLNEKEEETLYSELQQSKPHFFWVGLSTPKQERFMNGFLKKYPELTQGWGHGLVMLGVGAAFDFHTLRVKQAPFFVQRSGFEWLYRITQDPKRLTKRYLVSNTVFILKIIPQLLGLTRNR